MVRKPELVPRPLSQAAHNPPYPTTPPDEHPPPVHYDPHPSDGYQFVSHNDAHRPESDDEISSSSDWDEPEDDDDDQKDHVPAALRPGGHRPTSSQQMKPDQLPALLRVGPPGGAPAPRISIDSEEDRPQAEDKPGEKQPEPEPELSVSSPPPGPSTTVPPPVASPPVPTLASPVVPAASPPPAPVAPTPPPAASAAVSSPVHSPPERRPTIPLKSQNPYLNFQSPSTEQKDATISWSPDQSIPQEPVEMPLDNDTPVEQFSSMSLTNAAVSDSQAPPAKPPPTVPGDEPKSAMADSAPPGSKRHDSDASSVFSPGMDVSSLDGQSSRMRGLPEDSDAQVKRTWQEQQAWEKSERERREREAAEARDRAMQEERERQAEEEWHRGEAAAKAAAQTESPTGPSGEAAPPLPPRPGTSSTTAEPAAPPRAIDSSAAGGIGEAESPGAKQRKENYSIKHIRWFDFHTNSLREAPVLTQNANGPCPLLALVNALVLSTPMHQQSSLMEALKTRETISLGLLLDAVFDELMSGQRGTAAQELPDVGDLYDFLLALHTGMNVNPQFVGTADGSQGSNSQADPNPGSFEQTREMRLYSTFNVRLIHGWIPPLDSVANAAFSRSAKTYEDAQNIQFHEEELEAKLSTTGLSPQEQNLYEDLQAIKEFLQRYPTQLTDHGLKVIKESLRAGQFAILFRNDHFSTIYKEPRSQKILSLVTDAGYSGHEEIVWETLVDVTGRGSEMLSGDFRTVSHSQGPAQERPIRSLLDDAPPQQNDGFPNGGGITYPQQSGTVGAASTEQEDADLALALQLQEEEDDRHRRDAEERRRRENELSQNYLSNEANANASPRPGAPGRIADPIRGSDIRPLIPPRRNNVQTNRPQVEGEEPPPPTYEQAANSPAYVPGQGQGLPNPPQQAGTPGGHGHGRGQSAYASTSQGQSYFIGGRPNGRGRRTSQPGPAPAAGPSSGVPGRRNSGQAPGKDEKCIVM